MPTIKAALDAVRAELGEPDVPQPESPAEDADESETDKPASRSGNGDDA
jgi:hypothetical protein